LLTSFKFFLHQVHGGQFLANSMMNVFLFIVLFKSLEI